LGAWWHVANGLATGWNYTKHEPLLLQKVVEETTDHSAKRNGILMRTIRRQFRSITVGSQSPATNHCSEHGLIFSFSLV
jgi:hypothetical protein